MPKMHVDAHFAGRLASMHTSPSERKIKFGGA